MSEPPVELAGPGLLGAPAHRGGQIQKAASALVADEGVVVFRLARLRDALGDRWGHKRQQVWEFVDRFAKRIMASSDIFMRINEVEYLLSCPGRGENAAQAVAFRISEQTHSFFLGDDEPPAQHDVVTLMVAKDDAAKPHVIAAEVPPPPLDAATQFKGYAWRLVPIRTIRGRELEVRCRTVEVIPITGSPQPWLKVEVQVRDDIVGQLLDRSERQGLDPEDLLRIDTISLEYAANLVRSRPPRHARSRVLVEVSIRSTSLQTRHRLQTLISGIHHRIRDELRIEFVDIGPQMPRGRINEAVGLIQGYVDEVIPRVGGGAPSDLNCLMDRRWPGISMLGSDLREALRTEADVKAFRQIAVDLAPTLIVHDEGFGGMDLWLQLGVTHLSGHELQEIYVIPD